MHYRLSLICLALLVVIGCADEAADTTLPPTDAREHVAEYRAMMLNVSTALAAPLQVGVERGELSRNGAAEYAADISAATDEALLAELLTVCDDVRDGGPEYALRQWSVDLQEHYGLHEATADGWGMLPLLHAVRVCHDHGQEIIDYVDSRMG